VFGSIETLLLFSSVWYVCVILGRRMMVWQGSYKVRYTWWKSCGAMAKGFATENISIAGFCFVGTRGKLLG